MVILLLLLPFSSSSSFFVFCFFFFFFLGGGGGLKIRLLVNKLCLYVIHLFTGLIACTTERHSSCPAGDRPNSFTVTVQCMLLTCAPSSNCATLRGPGGRRCQLDDSHKTCSSNPGGCSCQTPVNGHSVYDRKLTPSRNESASWSCDDTCLDIYPATPHREEGDEDNPVGECHRLVGLVVKVSARVDSRFTRGDFSESSLTRHLKSTTPVATKPGSLQYRVSAGTGWPGVSILSLGEGKSLKA